MSRLRTRRIKAEDDVDIDMVPVMNMFLVLIPFLLMSASFLHLKGINTSVPVQAERVAATAVDPETKITVVVELLESGFQVSALADSLGQDDLDRLAGKFKKSADQPYAYELLVTHLERIKQAYPASDTILVIPAETVRYDAIIDTMDAARYSQEQPLFPNVVLTAKVG